MEKINTLKSRDIVDEGDGFTDSNEVMELTATLLEQARKSTEEETTVAIPIKELEFLGTTISGMVPYLQQFTSGNNNALYRVVNQAAGDVLKQAKDGTVWGAMKTAEGSSKMAKLVPAGLPPINPATMMVAAALYPIYQKLDAIIEMEKQILTFLEIEKEAQIEADVEYLADLLRKYKLNWDNPHFVTSSHKMVMDIQRTAKKHIISYKKKLDSALKNNQFLVLQSNVQDARRDFQKKLEYYRLSLYMFSMATLMEIMLSGNVAEENITNMRTTIEQLSDEYKKRYKQCTSYIEKLSKASVETNILKGVGDFGNFFGKVISDIPVIKDGQVDEFLQEQGRNLKQNAKNMEKSAGLSFEKMKDPQTSIFTDRMNEMIKIYHHTSEICFDANNIYLIAS